MTTLAAFDPVGQDQLDESLRLQGTEAIGRELARRCKQAMEAAASAREVSLGSRDLVVLASSAETAHMAAAWCGRLATAVCALIGNADVALVKATYAQSRKATGHAAVAMSRWQLATREKGGAA